ncbi:MAG: SDR family NAD(P)-dependent oxidoreductase [Bacteroidota bacterium]
MDNTRNQSGLSAIGAENAGIQGNGTVGTLSQGRQSTGNEGSQTLQNQGSPNTGAEQGGSPSTQNRCQQGPSNPENGDGLAEENQKDEYLKEEDIDDDADDEDKGGVKEEKTGDDGTEEDADNEDSNAKGPDAVSKADSGNNNKADKNASVQGITESEPVHENQVALITGATSGIGFEIAKCFAKDHYKLIIVGRSHESLGKKAEVLRNYGSPYVTSIAADLSKPDGAQKLYDEVKAKGYKVDFLVNNAGQGQWGKIWEYEFERDREMIQLNVLSLVQLTKLYVPDMLARGRGRILQLASEASLTPNPLLAVYAATKAFVLSFTDALINELEGTPVTVTAVLPTATDTDFFNKAGAAHTKAAQMAKEEAPENIANRAYDALMNGDHHVTAGVMNTLRNTMNQMMPNEMAASMARSSMEPVERN